VRVLVLAATAALLTVTADPAFARPFSLQRYLASMSWPVRASVLRAQSASDGIDGWFARGDPPYLGGIARDCRSLRAVERDPRGRLLKIAAPPRLRTIHLRLVRGYSAARAACGDVRTAALAFRAADERAYLTHRAADKAVADRAQAVARAEFRRGRRTIASFMLTVRAWRSAAFAEADATGVPAVWLVALRI
jgi:hypothetical protein